MQDRKRQVTVFQFLLLLRFRSGNSEKSTEQNERGEPPLDVVSGDWSEELARFYRYLDEYGDLNLDLEGIRKVRPQSRSDSGSAHE